MHGHFTPLVNMTSYSIKIQGALASLYKSPSRIFVLEKAPWRICTGRLLAFLAKTRRLGEFVQVTFSHFLHRQGRLGEFVQVAFSLSCLKQGEFVQVAHINSFSATTKKNAPHFGEEIRTEHASLYAHRAVTLKRPVSFPPALRIF